uniref:Uncharacterized protein n=1 Tax=Arundo donax TaxID=35708 RepID=A0A0A9EC69_ARUDO
MFTYNTVRLNAQFLFTISLISYFVKQVTSVEISDNVRHK